jgi:hypothetical protein
MSALFNDAAFGHDNDAVGTFNCGQAVRND